MHFSLWSFILSGRPETLSMHNLQRNCCFWRGLPKFSFEVISTKSLRTGSPRLPERVLFPHESSFPPWEFLSIANIWSVLWTTVLCLSVFKILSIYTQSEMKTREIYSRRKGIENWHLRAKESQCWLFVLEKLSIYIKPAMKIWQMKSTLGERVERIGN